MRFIAHGYSNSDTLAGMSESAETAYLQGVSSQIETAVGIRPRGWASPWIAETLHTPDLLGECGYSYVLDWCMDDQPVWLKTRNGGILSVPYSQEINDSSTIVGRQASAADFASMIIDQFDEMRATSGEEPLVMSVILHAFVSGQPFRLRALRRCGRAYIEARGRVVADAAGVKSRGTLRGTHRVRAAPLRGDRQRCFAICTHVRMGELGVAAGNHFPASGRDDMGRPLRAQSPYPGHSAAHPLNQQGQSLPLNIRRKRALKGVVICCKR